MPSLSASFILLLWIAAEKCSQPPLVCQLLCFKKFCLPLLMHLILKLYFFGSLRPLALVALSCPAMSPCPLMPLWTCSTVDIFVPLARVDSASVSGLDVPLKSMPHFCVLPRQLCSLSEAGHSTSDLHHHQPPTPLLTGLHSPHQQSQTPLGPREGSVTHQTCFCFRP